MSVIIHFFNGADKATENHYLEKEYRNDIIIQIGDLYYEVYFFTKDALEYEMRKDGFCAFPGMIILDEITNQKIFNAIDQLIKLDFFNSFIGYKENPINKSFVHRWYENELTKLDSSNLESHILHP